MHAKNTFGRAEKLIFLPMHVSNYMAKRGKLKKSHKKNVLNNPKHSAGRHYNFSTQYWPALFSWITVSATFCTFFVFFSAKRGKAWAGMHVRQPMGGKKSAPSTPH